MNAALLAISPASTWSLGDWLIAVVIIAACVGVAYLALNYFGIQIPQVLVRIFMICVVCAFAIVAIRFLFSL